MICKRNCIVKIFYNFRDIIYPLIIFARVFFFAEYISYSILTS